MSASPSPWDIDYFDPPTPHVPAPSPKGNPPKLVPELDRLFQVQRNALKVLNDLKALSGLPHKDPKVAQALHRLTQDAENTYRVIRSYLDKNAPK